MCCPTPTLLQGVPIPMQSITWHTPRWTMSCLYAGCTDPAALNYHGLFVLDDGSCIYGEVQDNTCPTDVDADGVVSTTDLLELLGSFGTLCD